MHDETIIDAMTSNYPAAVLANYDGDHRAAYRHLAKAFRALQKAYSESIDSRFIEVSRSEPESDIAIRKITEDQISRAVDMADCEDPGAMRKWLYVDDAGELRPVTIGPQLPLSAGAEQPLYCASSAIVAGGRCVGEVTYTDH